MVDEHTAFLHGKIIAICEAIKSEKIGIIAVLEFFSLRL